MYLKFMQAHRDQRQSNQLNRGPPKVSLALLFTGGAHIGTRAPHVLNLIWFGCITCPSQWGGGKQFSC
jgi:hypothetical protein